jgi:hypothetical protein
LAQRYINSSGIEKQAFANQEADNYDIKASHRSNLTVKYTNLSHRYLEQAQEAINKSLLLVRFGGFGVG